MPETVTLAGLFVIDGYRPGRDWLPLDVLFGALPSDGSVRVLWLGAEEGANFSGLFADLVDSGSGWSDPRRSLWSHRNSVRLAHSRRERYRLPRAGNRVLAGKRVPSD